MEIKIAVLPAGTRSTCDGPVANEDCGEAFARPLTEQATMSIYTTLGVVRVCPACFGRRLSELMIVLGGRGGPEWTLSRPS